MLTPKENFLETLKKDGKPDRLVNQYQPFVPIMNDPLQKFTRGNRVRGKTSVDRWGTEILFPEDAPGPMPHVTEANKVCPDVTRWQESVKVPDLIANCSDGRTPSAPHPRWIAAKNWFSALWEPESLSRAIFSWALRMP